MYSYIIYANIAVQFVIKLSSRLFAKAVRRHLRIITVYRSHRLVNIQKWGV